ncbi:hypothetical protein N4G65_41290, partial [Streptomyces fulvoviolaceus]|nr:hypothetical protein [Streptomyces fulvoviolaceus]
LWGGWFILHYLTFALAEGTFHPYYVTAMAPGIAALTGIGATMLYRAHREGSAAKWAWVLPAAIATSTVWAVYLLQRVSGSGTLYTVAEVVAGLAGAVAVLGLLLGRFTKRHRLTGLAALAAVVALLAGPAAYSVSAATTASTNGTNPTAGPTTNSGMGGGGGGGQRPSGNAPTSTAKTGSNGQSMGQPPSGGEAPSGSTSTSSTSSEANEQTGGGGGGGTTQVSSAMITYLKKNQDGATWLLAVATDQTASTIILESGQPVISMGGWSGSDNAMTLTKLKALVKSGKLHYIVISDSGQNSTSSAISTWVKKNGTAVTDYTGLYRLDTTDVS